MLKAAHGDFSDATDKPNESSPLTRKEECRLREHDALEWSTYVVVVAVIPEVELIVARAESQGVEVHLAGDVPGVQWRQLRTGQHLRVKLIGVLAPRVVSAAIA